MINPSHDAPQPQRRASFEARVNTITGDVVTIFEAYNRSAGTLQKGTEVDVRVEPAELHPAQNELVRLGKLIAQEEWRPNFEEPLAVFAHLQAAGLVPASVDPHLVSPNQIGDITHGLPTDNEDRVLQAHLRKSSQAVADALRTTGMYTAVTEDGKTHIFILDPSKKPGDKRVNFITFLSDLGHELGLNDDLHRLGIDVKGLGFGTREPGTDFIASEIRQAYFSVFFLKSVMESSPTPHLHNQLLDAHQRASLLLRCFQSHFAVNVDGPVEDEVNHATELLNQRQASHEHDTDGSNTTIFSGLIRRLFDNTGKRH